jgi:hypothetical protein
MPTTPDTVNILTLKWGARYGPVFLNQLQSAIKQHLILPFRILCFTDNGEGLNEGMEVFPIPELNLPI